MQDGRPTKTDSAQNDGFKRPMPKAKPGSNSKNASVKNTQRVAEAKVSANSKEIAQKAIVGADNSKPILQAAKGTEHLKHATPGKDDTLPTPKAVETKTSQAVNTAQKTKTPPSDNVAGQNKKPSGQTTQNNKQSAQGNETKQKTEPNKVEGNTKPQTNDVQKTGPVQDLTPKAVDKVSQGSETKKQEDKQSVPDKCVEGKRELDPLAMRILEQELQDIMIQVWQELPDYPEENEKVIVDKLRTEVGDDLKRVLGLNVTKRLLNVFNTLFVRIHFTRRPQMGCLTSFLKQYNIKQFKRIDNNSNIFAAQMANIEDFDKLCSNKELTCGDAKVKVLPCYRFTQCPENLKTIYDDTFCYEDSNQEPAELCKSDDAEKAGSETKSDKPVADKKDTNIPPTDAKDPIDQDLDINENDLEDLDVDIQEKDLDDFDADVQENDLEGEEELADEDILALMSEGVVVDECTGSDDEK